MNLKKKLQELEAQYKKLSIELQTKKKMLENRAQQEKKKEAERKKKEEAERLQAERKKKEAERIQAERKKKEAERIQAERVRAQQEKEKKKEAEKKQTENNLQNYCKELASCSSKLSPTVINEKRKQVYDKMIAYADLKEEDLQNTRTSIMNFSKKINSLKYKNKSFFPYLLDCYDTIFFDNKLRKNCSANNAKINITWNNKMTCTGGVCRFYKYRRETRIELSSKVFDEALKNLPENEVLSANGVQCNNMLNCLQLVFEHELVHAIIYIFCIEYGKKNSIIPTSCWTGKVEKGKGGHTKTFMSIVNNFFGQTYWKHDLLAFKQGRVRISEEKLGEIRDEYKIGDLVSFTTKKGIVHGVLKKKNPKYFKIQTQTSRWNVHPKYIVPKEKMGK